MILLLGADSYVGQAFARSLRRRKDSFIPLSRIAFDYTRFEFLFDYVRKTQPELVINADDSGGEWEAWHDGGIQGKRGKEDGNDEPASRTEMLQVNVLLPQLVTRVCSMTNTPWAHISCGSIYRGAKVSENGKLRLERDLSLPALRHLFASQPGCFRGFTEIEEANVSFKFAPCDFYCGTKALAEEAIREPRDGYIWRFRLPFNQEDGPRNFLTLLSNLSHVRDAIQCLSQVDECANACLELWERRSPFGIYNVVNSGGILTGEVIALMRQILNRQSPLNLLVFEHPSGSSSDQREHSGCLLDSSKLCAHGIRLRTVREAIEQSLKHWQPHTLQGARLLA